MSSRDRSRKQGWVGVLEFVLGHLATRLVLSVAIIVSLVPHEWMHATDAWFLVLFVPEFVARAILACRKEAQDGTPDPLGGTGWRAPRPLDVFLLAVDLVALISFLPFHGWFDQQARWLRLFRLTRTVMLFRYWAPLVKDLWSVLRRRERSRQLSLMAAAVVIVAFAGTVFLNHATDAIGEDFDGDGNIGDEHDHVFWVRMWWAFRQIQDPGNMLASPHEIATLVVSVFLTVFGLFLVSFLIGVGTDVVAELMDLSKLRSSGLRRHTVLINITPSTRQLLDEVMGEYKKLVPEGLRMLSLRWFRELGKRARQQREFVVVGRTEEPPDFLREPQFARIIYRENSDDDDEAFLERADVPVARRVLVLADTESSEDPDDETVRTLLTIVERLREEADADETHRTTLIAEILDESNVGAAHKAIARASGQVDAHVIPTERMLSLFTYCVARRGGAARLLMTMLTSAGHELYIYDWRRAEEHGGRMPALPGPSAHALEMLYWRGLGRSPNRRVLPVGMLLAPPGADVERGRVVLNPGPDAGALEEDEQAVGFVALAPNMRVATEFADEVLAQPAGAASPVQPGAFALPTLSPSAPNPLRRVLICGFRPATVNLIEAIVTAEPEAEVLLMVEDLAARKEALDAFDGHTNLVRTGLLQGARGTFTATDDPAVLACSPGTEGQAATGRVYVEIGDWTSSRRLMRLPRDFGTAPEVDLVVMVSSQRHRSDAATTTALMKLEHLQDHLQRQTGRAPTQTVVAEVINADLAHRISRRYDAMGRDNVIVFSLHELRAFFMFQSVVVPNFNLVYGQLMAPWGQSFVRLEAVGERRGVCTFAQLASQLRTPSRIPVAVELVDPTTGVRSLYVGQGDPERDDLIDLAQLDAVWVIRPEQKTQTARYTNEGTQIGPAPSAPISVPAQ